MIKIIFETHNENCVETIEVRRKCGKSTSWLKMKHTRSIRCYNLSELTIKAIKGKCNVKNPTKEQIRKYTKYGKEFIHNLNGMFFACLQRS